MLGIWAVFLTALTYILGAPALKTLRRRLGRPIYWSASTFICMAMYAGQARILAIAFYSLVVLVGVFEEFEEMGLGFKASAFFTLLINSLLSAGGFALWVFYTGSKWSDVLLAHVDGLLKPVMELNPNLKVSVADVILQLPSVTVISWIIAIYVAVLLERPQDNPKLPSLRSELNHLKLPDACVWLFIAALLGSFGGFKLTGLETLAINVLNVTIVLFFFQGIAVVSRFFERVRMGVLWQSLFMFLIVVQLFLFVSVLGLADHWLDFRLRMEKRAEQFKRET